MTEGPLHSTWIDKPHRLVYDLIAAVRYYASAPPAPQAVDNWRKYATEREDTAQAVIERHREEIKSLLNLLAKDRQTIADLRAAIGIKGE